MKFKLPFKTRKQLNIEIAHLTEQLRICSFEREKESSRNNFEETRLECEVMNLKEQLASHDSDIQLIEDLRKQLAEANELNTGLASSVSELKKRNKDLKERIRDLEAKQPKIMTAKPKATKPTAKPKE